MTDETPRLDWDAIELDYRAGVLPVVAICVKHGVSPSRLATVADQKGWVRLPPPRAEDVFGLATNGHLATPPGDEPAWTPEEAKRAQLIASASVINTHRKDVAKLRGSAALLTERLQLILMGESVTLPCLGARESPADLLEKISRVLVRTVQLERQAYNLEAFQQNPGASDDNLQQAVSDEIAQLRAKVDEVANSKARDQKAA